MSEQKPLILVDGVASTITAELSPEYIALRDSTLEKTAAIVLEPTTDEEAQAAMNVSNVARGFVKTIEDEREKFKRPILDAGSLLDKVAKQGKQLVQKEIERIEDLVGCYVLKKRKAAERAAQEARERELAAAREQERLQREAAEAANRAAQAKTKAAREKAEAEAAKLRKQQMALAIAQAEEEPHVPETPTALKGAAIKSDWNIQITDLHALYAYNRDAVKLEPLMSVVRQMIERGETIPGVTYSEKARIDGRANQSNIALQ